MAVVEVSWERTRRLRREVLGWADVPVPGDQDAESVHLAVLDDRGEPAAVVSACPHPCQERPGAAATYFWAMAVADGSQHRGLGSELVAELTKRSALAGGSVLWADARESAVGFYMRCGATPVGDPYQDPITGLEDRRVVFDLPVS